MDEAKRRIWNAVNDRAACRRLPPVEVDSITNAFYKAMVYGLADLDGIVALVSSLPVARAEPAPLVNTLVNALTEIRTALSATSEFDNFECDYGPPLGTCTNDDCLPCRVYRALESLPWSEGGYVDRKAALLDPADGF